MAGVAASVRQLAYGLHADASLGGRRRDGPAVRRAARASHDPRVSRLSGPGQHIGQSASRWHRRSQKNGPQAIGKSRGGWNTKVHLIAANDRFALTFSLSGGNAHDAPEGRALLTGWDAPIKDVPLLMDRAYEGDETRQLVLDLGMNPIVPPKANRLVKWDYDRTLYKRRNEVERLFRRLKGFRRIFSRFEKLDVMYRAFLNFALIVDMIKC